MHSLRPRWPRRAMLLGTAKVLAQIQEELTGQIYFCFQVAEEVGGGAGEIVQYLEGTGWGGLLHRHPSGRRKRRRCHPPAGWLR